MRRCSWPRRRRPSSPSACGGTRTPSRTTSSTGRAFAAYLSVLLGFPHALWRDRHLAHHAGVAARTHLSRDLVMQASLVLAFWSVMLAAAPLFFLAVYLPGWATG